MIERSKKTITAWRKFLDTAEGKEGLDWYRDQYPAVEVSQLPHLMSFASGKMVQHIESVNMIHQIGMQPPPKSEPDELDKPLIPNS
jgi:hypothetical protein